MNAIKQEIIQISIRRLSAMAYTPRNTKSDNSNKIISNKKRAFLSQLLSNIKVLFNIKVQRNTHVQTNIKVLTENILISNIYEMLVKAVQERKCLSFIAFSLSSASYE